MPKHSAGGDVAPPASQLVPLSTLIWLRNVFSITSKEQ